MKCNSTDKKNFTGVMDEEVLNVTLLHGCHLYWPDLDVDLEVDSLENPQKYPLIFE